MANNERELLVAIRPPKKVSEMSDEERDAFVDALYEVAKARLLETVNESDA